MNSESLEGKQTGSLGKLGGGGGGSTADHILL